MDYMVPTGSIAKSSLLDASDDEFLRKNIEQIEQTHAKRQKFRTETEMRMSVLNDIKFPTAAAKYWQCVREQSVFYEQLVQLSFEYRRNDIELKKLAQKLEQETDTLEQELLKIDIEEAEWKKLNMSQVAKDRAREIRLWSQLMDECVEADPNFDKENVNTHQLKSYALRFQAQAKNLGNPSPSELSNLMGQYQTTLRMLEGKGLLVPPAIKEQKKLEHEKAETIPFDPTKISLAVRGMKT